MKALILYLLVGFSGMAFAQSNASDVLGTWMTADKDAKIQIYKEGKFYKGKIVWLKDPIDKETGKPLLDKHNPDPAQRSRPAMGQIMMWDFTFEDGEYIDGKIYDGNEGETYDSAMWLEDKNTLSLRGYWGWFYRTETWTRV